MGGVAVTVVLLDGVTYGWHRAYHGVPLLWRLHRIHHSQIPQHTNSDYGTIFPFWDRLFRTYRFIEAQRALVLGLPEYPRPSDVTVGKILAMPFSPPCGWVQRQEGPLAPAT